MHVIHLIYFVYSYNRGQGILTYLIFKVQECILIREILGKIVNANFNVYDHCPGNFLLYTLVSRVRMPFDFKFNLASGVD